MVTVSLLKKVSIGRNDLMKKLLVDADIMIFQSAASNQKVYVWDEEISSEVIDRDKAIEDVESFIDSLLKSTGTKEALFCFSSSPNFRYSVLPSYKHNRKGKEKPKLLPDLRAYVEENYPTKIKPCLEADDVLGILATISPNKYVLASIDKDLLQIPATHYNWRTGETVEVSVEEADRFFYKQVLTGDSTDGYKGCPSIGQKRAEKILDEITNGDYWTAIVATYEKKGLTEKDALQQARVARILRKSDYDFVSNEPKMWLLSHIFLII